MLGAQSCSSTNTKSSEPSYGVMRKCVQDSLPAYQLNGVVAEYLDNYEDKIHFHVRFYDTRLFNQRVRLKNEEQIIKFMEGDDYDIIEIMQKGQEFPSAVIYRNFENKPICIRYYTKIDSSRQECNEIFYPSWDVAYIRIAGNQILENLSKH